MMQLELSMTTPVDEANEQQRLASTPTISVFVSASAGSGKTKLLVDRLLRLMLPRKGRDGTLQPGTHPQKIQCLTYSKAAAAEMAIRLQRKLSEWVGYSQTELDRALLDLQIEPDDVMRKAARALFAQVLDLPGGMRIETNHAFCQSILQRFPLEASINPQFKIIEEGDNILAFKRAFDEKIHLASKHDIQLLSPIVSSQNFLEILQELQQNQRFLPAIFELVEQGNFDLYLRQLLQLSYASKAEYLSSVCQEWRNEEEFKSYLEQALVANAKILNRIGEACLQWLANSIDQRIALWGEFTSCFLTQQNDVKSIQGTNKDNPDIAHYFIKQGEYILEVIDQLNRYVVYEYTLALMHVFSPIWQRYQEIKRNQGALYYNDLIAYTLVLLDDPGSAWVLYKLDGGLDHILLDEVQDNSAEQWKIAADLSIEFFSGIGRDEDQPHPRTVFAVGDYKQSIYSFQGAKPQEFLRWHQIFKQTVLQADHLWEDPQLRVSFRSSQIILNFVDKVFDPKQGLQGLSGMNNDQALLHRSAKENAPGRVDIWPLMHLDSVDTKEEMALWNPLKENQKYQNVEGVLAKTLADWIAEQIGKVPPYGGKPIQAGDILILIRKRSVFSKALIRALKSKNIPLANLVKTQLLDQLAVQDLLVLCEVLLLPQDDLALACVLKSPLGGLSEESLMELAAPRKNGQSLWGALFVRHKEREDWAAVWKMLSSLFLRIDFVTPHALLVEILGEHQGRTKLLARLGGEAIEAIDELLSQALQYETLHTPSLQGFLYWLKQSERTIKNEAESTVDMVRLMTVHGAKGLQGRLVILPDTMGSASIQGGFQVNQKLIWKKDPSHGNLVPLYIPQRQFDIAESKFDKKVKDQNNQEESNRLLYVALTRASEWLLICGWQKNNNEKKKSKVNQVLPWYEHCIVALRELKAYSRDFTKGWEGEHLWIEHQSVVKTPSDNITPSKKAKTQIKLPNWMGQKNNWVAKDLPSEKLPTTHLAPSRPEGVELGDIPSFISPLQTKVKRDPLYRGRLVHQLLQYLPDCPPEQRSAIALQWLKPLENQFLTKEIQKLIDQVLQIITHPLLYALFDQQSLVEQPLVGTVNGVVITGQIDRMRILSDQILLCDFKSGRKIPDKPEDTPAIYLKQMAAYWSLLSVMYPRYQINSFIVWTDTAKIMMLPQEILINYIPSGKDRVS